MRTAKLWEDRQAKRLPPMGSACRQAKRLSRLPHERIKAYGNPSPFGHMRVPNQQHSQPTTRILGLADSSDVRKIPDEILAEECRLHAIQ